MMTFQSMRMKTEYMVEEMRRRAIDETLEKWEAATRRYYESDGEEGGKEAVDLYKELERLGANMDYVMDRDFEIRDEVYGDELKCE